MRVAIVSHGALVRLNRRPYDLLATAHGLEATVIVPDRWLGDLPNPDLRVEPPSGAGLVALRGRATGDGSRFWLHQLRPTLRKLRPDLILLDEEPWSVVAWQALRADRTTPLVVYSKQNIAKRLPPPFSWMRTACYRRARAAWAVGETTAEVLRATGYGGSIDLVPHGVEITRFTPGRDEERRRAYGLVGVVIGYAGRLVDDKGIAELLDATARLAAAPPSDLPPFTVLVVGSGPLTEAVRQAANGPLAGRLRFLPAVPHDEAPGLYRLMDVFVLPSRTTARWREQFGRALVEAAATALPLVAADSGEIPHVVRALGGGRVVPERDPAALAAALAALVRDPGARASLGRTNLEAAHARFSQEAVARRMAELLAGAAR